MRERDLRNRTGEPRRSRALSSDMFECDDPAEIERNTKLVRLAKIEKWLLFQTTTNLSPEQLDALGLPAAAPAKQFTPEHIQALSRSSRAAWHRRQRQEN